MILFLILSSSFLPQNVFVGGPLSFAKKKKYHLEMCQKKLYTIERKIQVLSLISFVVIICLY